MTTVPRLNDTFSPTHYALSLDLSQADKRQFSGLVTIDGQLLAGEAILLHAKDLTIHSALIDGRAAEVSHGEHDELRLTQAGLAVGEHLVVIEFSGDITDAMHGMYPCYFQHDGVKKELFTTQFESHHAREVFPCVDEPAAKATYDVTLTTQPDVTVLGNMPVRQQRQENGRLVTSFETTPRMSSYLLAWVVGELHKKTALTKRGVEVSVWATPAHSPLTLDFALKTATRSIDFFEKYFGVNYPLPKSDHVALPDFSSGAMENWGLITYRESCLLADDLTPEASRRFIATVIAHELSHQWFGNLVTMQWWNDLWLNESFANMMEYVAIDALHPEWRMWEEFATHEVTAALRRDSLDGVQAVQTDINHPDEINTLFDPAIVYAKGGRLINMVRQLIGEEAFRAGLKAYFEKFAYQNTVGDDLWRQLEAASGQPIINLMNRWISQPGLPLVSVSYADGNITIRQQRFFIGQHQPSEELWPIPLFASQPLEPVMNRSQASYPTNGAVQLNCNLQAHFVTQYDDVSRRFLLATAPTMSTLNKLCLLQDMPLLVRAGLASSDQLLPLSQSFQHETNQQVYHMATLALAELRKFVDDNELARRQLKNISANFAQPTLAELGWDEHPGESDDDRERRSMALSLALYGEDTAALTEAKRRFDTTDLTKLSPELRPSILSAVVKHFETPQLIDQLLDTYTNTPSSDLQHDITGALTSTDNPTTTERLLAEIKSSHRIRPQDASRWFAYLMRNRLARPIAWQWLKDNWNWVTQTFGGDKSYDDFLRYAAMTLLTRAELDDFIDFTAPLRAEPALTRTIDLGVTEITARVELVERDGTAVLAAIAQV